MLFRPNNKCGSRLLPSAAAGLVLLAQAGLPLLAQQGARPLVYHGGVVNAASFAPAGGPGGKIAPGSIASIFGSNLALQQAQATSLPLPFDLAGTRVTFDGVPAPLFYASPNQLNVQIPYQAFVRMDLQTVVAQVAVTTPNGTSDPVDVEIAQHGPGIFTTTFDGCGRPAVLNVADDGSVSLNTPVNAAEPGKFVSIFETGTGQTTAILPPDGHPAPLTGPPLVTNAGALIDGQSPPFSVAAKAPGLVGLDQINVRLPEEVREGCAVPLTMLTPNASSQPVALSIRKGGGQCIDPPPDALARLIWQRSFASGLPDAEEGARFVAELESGVGARFPPTPQPVAGTAICSQVIPPGPRCPNLESRTLAAGTLTIQSPTFGPLQVLPRNGDGNPAYEVDLPADSVKEGEFSVTADGSDDVGPFAASVTIPPPIEILTDLSPQTVISPTEPFVVQWRGGNQQSIVRMRVSVTISENRTMFCEVTAMASEGRAELGTVDAGDSGLLPLPIVSPVEVTLIMEPADPTSSMFSASGLTLGGRHVWRYEFRFGDLRFP